MVREGLEPLLRERLGTPPIPVSYVLQRGGRERPWGTGHAVLAAADQVDGPFMVINADDFYGAGTYVAMAEYLTAALEDPNPDVFLAAVGNVAKARGMSSIAEESGLGRESLYKALTPGAKPRYDTVLKVLQSLGVKLSVSAA